MSTPINAISATYNGTAQKIEAVINGSRIQMNAMEAEALRLHLYDALKAWNNSNTPSTKTIEFAPVGCETPEGAARVAKTMKEFEHSGAQLANATIEFFDDHEGELLDCMEMVGSVTEDIHQIRALIGARRRNQEAFLRAVNGR
jgi:hypothetical protein